MRGSQLDFWETLLSSVPSLLQNLQWPFLAISSKILLQSLFRGLHNMALFIFRILFPQSQLESFIAFWVPEQGLLNVSDGATVKKSQ